MMATDVKRLSEAKLIDTSRCEAKSDRVRSERRMDAELMAAATVDVAGRRRWFALRTANRCEVDLRDMLCDARVDAVVPVKEKQIGRRAGSRGGKVVHRPVLAGLVFVKLVPSHNAFAGLARIRDVVGFVGRGERPHPIGDREMNGFMDLAQAGAFDERNTPSGLVVGSRVRISVGPFADFEGVLEGYARGRTARVLTWLFGQEMTVDVKLAHLDKSD